MLKVTSSYKFFPIKRAKLKGLKASLLAKAKSLNVKGLALIGEEGLNAAICGKEREIELFKKYIRQLFKEDFFWKDSPCEKWSFKLMSVKIKKEIIKSGASAAIPKAKNSHLSPEKWESKLKNRPQILDVRNNYETELGRFKGAKDLNLNNFQELADKLKNLSMDKNKETLIYCTGGIRCEKALNIMKSQGFKKVYQLEGGILNYLKKFPDSYFERECFVFDRRAAVDQRLCPTKRYALCPHCGQPGDLKISCRRCEAPAIICRRCKKRAPHSETCSKNCAYHFKKGHKCRKRRAKKESLASSL